MSGDPGARPQPALVIGPDDGCLASVFLDLVYRTGALHRRIRKWPVAHRSLPRLPKLIASAEYLSSGCGAVGEINGVLIFLEFTGGSVTCRLAAQDPDCLDSAEREIRALVPRRADREEGKVSLRVWWRGRYGADFVSRSVAAPAWAEVEHNYSAKTRSALGELMAGYRPGRSGQLVLFHGPPGTGKTFALRALCREWRSWCDSQYVVDPDVLFGSAPDYLLDVLTDDADSRADGEPRDEEDNETRWRLLILEDTGELLSADAKERTGQGLSRLLNLVDGVLGQGQRLLVLVTTNEPLGRLHAAVARPGRCSAAVEFPAFSAAEATAWLHRHEQPASVSGAATLASLYARLDGREPEAETAPIGFAAALGA